ncbi:LOW QUALITY PROTEIN: hypothetical protein TorRG33x02_029130, partial [Trema orientale]
HAYAFSWTKQKACKSNATPSSSSSSSAPFQHFLQFWWCVGLSEGSLSRAQHNQISKTIPHIPKFNNLNVRFILL